MTLGGPGLLTRPLTLHSRTQVDTESLQLEGSPSPGSPLLGSPTPGFFIEHVKPYRLMVQRPFFEQHPNSALGLLPSLTGACHGETGPRCPRHGVGTGHRHG